jgi:hypothetical protein
MNIYLFTGNGVSLGSELVVLADDTDTALILAKAWMIDHQLDPDSLHLQTENPFEDRPQIIHANDGDY